jgi:hypothetical protein
MTRPVTSGAGVSRCDIVLSSKRHLRRRLRKQKQEQEQKTEAKAKEPEPMTAIVPLPSHSQGSPGRIHRDQSQENLVCRRSHAPHSVPH